MRVLCLFLITAASTIAADPSASEIMAQVAANQDRAVAARTQYVYTQTSRVRVFKGKRKRTWDETREYTVTPTGNGVESRLQQAFGERREHGRMVPFHFDGPPPEEDGFDADLAGSLHDHFEPRDEGHGGFASDLFPFTSEQQARCNFRLAGVTEEEGRQLYRIEFEPKQDGLFDWEGEALIDREEQQPVRVNSNLAVGIPLWVRAVFGINIRQLGFSTRYARFDQDVWFPASYGGEFSFRIFHFVKRMASVSVVTKDFRRTAVESSLEFDDTSPVPPPKELQTNSPQ